MFLMISIKFRINHRALDRLESFLDECEVTNASIFEAEDFGFSKDIDNNGFQIANYFNIEILQKTKIEAMALTNKLRKEFSNLIRDMKFAELEDKDWIDLYKKEFQPVMCGGFYLYNEAIDIEQQNQSDIPIKLNSALAFGSGHHQTTKGCIQNLRYLEGLGIQFKDILYMGCGTGVLGICALKIWPKSMLLGVDIDSDAIRITKQNFIDNDIKGNAITSGDVPNGSFGLILCNILKQPLIDMCKSFFDNISDGGHIIISGFITSQEEVVVRKYIETGFVMLNRIEIEDWVSIVFKK